MVHADQTEAGQPEENTPSSISPDVSDESSPRIKTPRVIRRRETSQSDVKAKPLDKVKEESKRNVKGESPLKVDKDSKPSKHPILILLG